MDLTITLCIASIQINKMICTLQPTVGCTWLQHQLVELFSLWQRPCGEKLHSLYTALFSCNHKGESMQHYLCSRTLLTIYLYIWQSIGVSESIGVSLTGSGMCHKWQERDTKGWLGVVGLVILLLYMSERVNSFHYKVQSHVLSHWKG